MYLIDTNICIYIMNNRPQEVIQKCRYAGVGNVHISSVTTSELCYGVSKSQKVVKELLSSMVKSVLVLKGKVI